MGIKHMIDLHSFLVRSSDPKVKKSWKADIGQVTAVGNTETYQESASSMFSPPQERVLCKVKDTIPSFMVAITHFFLRVTDLFERQTDREGVLPSTSSFSKLQQWPELSQVKARSLEFHLAVSHG